MADGTQEDAPRDLPGALGGDLTPLVETRGSAAPALAIWFDDKLFDRARMIAGYLADAKGFVPAHLEGKPRSCFAVVERALTWRLSAYAVAQATYETPGGRVGYEGKLCQAILENSGRILGPVTAEHYGSVAVKFKNGRNKTFHTNDPKLEEALKQDGVEVTAEYDWSSVQGKYKIEKSQKGREYPVPTWTDADAAGLGVTISAQISGEPTRRTFDFDLIQAWPRNSTLWATDAKTQLHYAAVRRFASVVCPGLFMGVPFDQDDIDPALLARDVTPPRPARTVQQVGGDPFNEKGAATTSKEKEKEDISYTLANTLDGTIEEIAEVDAALEAYRAIMDAAEKGAGDKGLDGFWEGNGLFLIQLRERGRADDANALGAEYSDRLKKIEAAKREAQAKADAEEAAKKAAAAQEAAAKAAATPPEGPKPQDTKQTAAKGAKKGADAPPVTPDAPKAKWVASTKDKMPKSPVLGGSAFIWVGWVKEQLSTMPKDQIPDFLEQFKDAIEWMKKERQKDFAEAEAIIAGR